MKMTIYRFFMKYLALPLALFATGTTALMATPHAGDIGVSLGLGESGIKMVYILLFFVSHMIFFAPFASAKATYRMIPYVIVLFTAFVGTYYRYQNVDLNPQQYIKHDVFTVPYNLKHSI